MGKPSIDSGGDSDASCDFGAVTFVGSHCWKITRATQSSCSAKNGPPHKCSRGADRGNRLELARDILHGSQGISYLCFRHNLIATCDKRSNTVQLYLQATVLVGAPKACHCAVK